MLEQNGVERVHQGPHRLHGPSLRSFLHQSPRRDRQQQGWRYKSFIVYMFENRSTMIMMDAYQMAWSLSLSWDILLRSSMKRLTMLKLASSPGSKPWESCKIKWTFSSWKNSKLMSALPGSPWETCCWKEWSASEIIHNQLILQRRWHRILYWSAKTFHIPSNISTVDYFLVAPRRNVQSTDLSHHQYCSHG